MLPVVSDVARRASGGKWLGIVICALLLPLLMAVENGHSAEIEADPSNYKTLIGALKPGDTLTLAAGTYPPLVLSNLAGTPSAWITVQGPTVGAPAAITVNPANRTCCNLLQITESSYIAIKRLHLDSAMVNSVVGVHGRGLTHHILVENCMFVGQGSHQQTVALSTKGAAHHWIIRGNTILGAGTGMYLGNSTGDSPFIAGLVENNLIVDTIGYNLQLKWQLPYELPLGLHAGPHRTIIRHNVFVKTRPQSGLHASKVNGVRPNVLIGGQSNSGAGASDSVELYGNFFYDNQDGESLLQASGSVSVHDNIFVGGSYRAISLVNHDLPLRRAYVYNNTIYGPVHGIAVEGDQLDDSLVTGNLILASGGVIAPVQADNIVDSMANADSYVNQPSLILGHMDFYPKPGRAKGTTLDLSKMIDHLDYSVDFNGHRKGALEYRGAYAGDGVNPGWHLQSAKRALGTQ